MPEITLATYTAGTIPGVYIDRARIAGNPLFYVTSRSVAGGTSTIPKWFANGADATAFAVEVATGQGLRLFDRAGDA